MHGVGAGERRAPVIIAIPDAPLRNRFATLVGELGDFDVVAGTTTLMDTYSEVEARVPRVVLIAARLAAEPEYEVMRALFASLDVRWIVVRDRTGRAEPRSAGQPGGSDLFALPAEASTEVVAELLRSVTRRAVAPRPSGRGRVGDGLPAQRCRIGSAGRDDLVLIGASTGGVEALLTVLASFGADCPPTVVVQHTGNGFGRSLASLLDRHCAPRVRVAEDGAALEPGLVLVGAGTGRHVLVAPDGSRRIALGGSDPVSGHCPSVDALFRSAIGYPGRIVAAVLTGMGRDGAEGLLALRHDGRRTIAQDAATSVVHGMPRAAAELGGAEKILPLDRIGAALLAGLAKPVAGGAR